ncbi:hypothetical protein [Alteribacter salitolerans]|nr:hypothetical protein [Alteribacter salitolerans]
MYPRSVSFIGLTVPDVKKADHFQEADDSNSYELTYSESAFE